MRSMSGSPKMTKRLPLPVALRSSAMCRSAFMRALSTGMRPSLVNSGVWASWLGDQDVEAGVSGLARGGDQIGALDGAELRADEDRGALLCFAFEVAALGADEIAGPGREGRERDPVLLVRLLDTGDVEV